MRAKARRALLGNNDATQPATWNTHASTTTSKHYPRVRTNDFVRKALKHSPGRGGVASLYGRTPEEQEYYTMSTTQQLAANDNGTAPERNVHSYDFHPRQFTGEGFHVPGHGARTW